MDTTRATHDEVVEATAEREAEMRAQRIPINVYEAPEALVLIAPVPAVTANDVVVQLRGRTLRISADLRVAGPREYLVQEWDYGGYERAYELPDGYGSDVEAALTNGQLVVRVLAGDAGVDVDVTPSAH